MCRAALGWNREQLAERAGISADALRNMEHPRDGSEQIHARLSTVQKVVEALEELGFQLDSDEDYFTVRVPRRLIEPE